MMMKLLSLIAALSVIGNSQEIVMCPELRGVIPFDYEKFSGDWYNLARISLPFAPHENAVCWKIHVEWNGTRMELEELPKYKDGSSNVFSVRGYFSDLVDKGGIAQSSFNLGPGQPYRSSTRQAIPATDYTTFAIHHGCVETYSETTDKFSRYLVAEVWSRSPTMDPVTLDALKIVASNTLSVEPSSVTDVNQSGCD